MVPPSGDQQDVDQLLPLFRLKQGDVEGRLPRLHQSNLLCLGSILVHQQFQQCYYILLRNLKLCDFRFSKQRIEGTYVSATEQGSINKLLSSENSDAAKQHRNLVKKICNKSCDKTSHIRPKPYRKNSSPEASLIYAWFRVDAFNEGSRAVLGGPGGGPL